MRKTKSSKMVPCSFCGNSIPKGSCLYSKTIERSKKYFRVYFCNCCYKKAAEEKSYNIFEFKDENKTIKVDVSKFLRECIFLIAFGGNPTSSQKKIAKALFKVEIAPYLNRLY